MSKLSMYPITLDGKSVDEKRQEIIAYFNNTFDLFEKVFELLRDESVFYKKSEPTRHPMIFYFGHTATFFINKLINMKIISERINPEFESIFAVGVDEMDWDDMEESRYRWPKVTDVRSYRDKVRTVVNGLIESLEFSLPIRDDSPMWIILMGIEHERIHIETSLVLHRQMPIEFIQKVEDFILCPHAGEVVKNEMLQIKGGFIELGKNKEHHLYGWDNEYGSYSEEIDDFQAAKYLVSNGEFLEFVEAGGYENESYWDEEGLEFLRRSGVKHPHFWVASKDGYKYRALAEIIEMPLNWPVDVNALEAEAFCRYKSQKEGVEYKLPSEAEYAAIYKASGLYDIPELHESRANINFYHYASSCPVDEFGFNGIYDVIGNVWQWSRTPIRGFAGFEVHEAYDDFSTPTFDEKHALILGASWASSGNLIMKHSRYAFRKHFFQNAGFRYVVSENEAKEEDIYESDALVSQYCEFQYGDERFGVENFAVKCADIAAGFADKKIKALDLGCATGRASFELAKYFDAVEGIDFSVRFIGVGSKLKNDGYVAYNVPLEGDITREKKITLQELGYETLKDKVSFWQGDACNLKPNFTGYDLVMATNLIDRLYNPKLFLEDIAKRINRGGILVLTSPYTWQESSTANELWLGGYYDDDGRPIRTIDALRELLQKDFDFVHSEDVEFVIAETARKHQHTVSELSVWKRR
ncbi:5-histidylcysteine sulfoxide synthase [Sulfurimonas paralvinellae]|uniref:5-histidylcysteine sulfoxide synthase n=1 Tax=Sulfurimonas paralvinellae TaxID=317658 RepID=A0A7M1B904_9BACT|nr:5-histidylcysteine sulfoxide synthase [Sulfurimonas paralvinellae]QOP46209.1 5-histidylcysteine sulfoxide synthase [Sulfurimonas paralvinellae]